MQDFDGTARACRILAVLAGLLAAPLYADTESNRLETAVEKETPQTIRHAGVGCRVEVSSTHIGEEGEGQSSALVDGDLATRWSSDYSEPQEVKVDLGSAMSLARIRLHWERASAARYAVAVSTDGEEWTNVHLMYMKTRGEPESRIDSVGLKGVSARFIRLDLLGCVNSEWGFSLYEIEIVTAGEGAAADMRKDAGETGRE